MKNLQVSVGSVVTFKYADKPRVVRVEKVGNNLEWFQGQMLNAGPSAPPTFRTFSVSKIQGQLLKVV